MELWPMNRKQLRQLMYHVSLVNSFNRHYRQFSNISRTQSQNINVSRLVLLLSFPNPLKPGVKLRMKM